MNTDYATLAQNAGLSPELAAYMPTYVDIESGGNPNARTGSYSGLLQLSNEERAKYGNGFNMYARKAQDFADKYGRQPNPTELYLLNQQGVSGLPAHLANPSGVAWQNIRPYYKNDAIAKQAIWGNVPDNLKPQYGSVDNLTSQQFYDLWQNRVENRRAPMATAMQFAQNNNGKTMADYPQPILSPGAVAGPSAMYGGTTPTPLGGFADVLKRLGVGANEDIGRKLQNAGAALIAVGNPAGGAALQNAANMPMFKQNFGIISDSIGNQYILNHKTGQLFDTSGRPLGGGGIPGAPGAPGAPAQDGGVSPQQAVSDRLANSPKAMQERLKLEQETASKTLEEMSARSNAAKRLSDRAEEMMKFLDDPNVPFGGGAEFKQKLKNTAAGFGYTPAGTDQGAAFDKGGQQMVKDYLQDAKGVRFAGPEISYSQSALPSLDKPREANRQILQDIIRNANMDRDAYKIALEHYGTHGNLGQDFRTKLNNYFSTNPAYKADAVQPSAPKGAEDNGFKILKVH